MKGRKPTPTPILKIRGSRRAKDREGSPEPAVGRPDPPAFIAADPVAAAEWDDVCGQMEGMGTLSPLHGSLLAAYCAAVSRLTAAEMFIREHGLSSDGKHGRRKNPEVTIAEKASEQIKALAAELCISPASHSRAKPLGKPEEKGNKKSRFFA